MMSSDRICVISIPTKFPKYLFSLTDKYMDLVKPLSGVVKNTCISFITLMKSNLAICKDALPS